MSGIISLSYYSLKCKRMKAVVYCAARIFLISLFLVLNIVCIYFVLSGEYLYIGGFVVASVLYLADIAIRFKTDVFYLNTGGKFHKYNDTVTVGFSLKLSCVYFLLGLFKIFYVVLFSLPGVSFFILLQVFAKGIIKSAFYVLTASFLFMAFLGSIFGCIIVNRYNNVIRLLAEDSKKKIRDALRESIVSMNGKCVRCFVLKLLPFKMTSRTAVCFESCKKIKIPQRTKTDAEKSIVYYFGKVTA